MSGGASKGQGMDLADAEGDKSWVVIRSVAGRQCSQFLSLPAAAAVAGPAAILSARVGREHG